MKTQQDIVLDLKNIFGEHVVTNKEALVEQSADYIGYRRWERYNGKNLVDLADCIVKAQSTEDVSKALKYCNENKIKVVPQSGRSCVCGGFETTEGSVIIDCSDMNEIVKFDEENYMITARAGTPMEYIENYCNERGFTTGHYPQSLPLAQIGGLVSTRSIGQLSTLYGGIEDMLHGMEAVLADGSVIRIKSIPRRAAGPELNQLFMGSEGGLGIVTEATLKLHKLRAENWKRAYAIKDFKAGLKAIQEIMQAGYKPAVVRLHDDVEAEMSYSSYIEDGEHIILLVVEGPEYVVEGNAKGIEEIMSRYDVRDLGSKPVEHWYSIRNATCDDLYAYNKKGLIRDTCEISSNWSDIYDIYESVLKRFPDAIEDVTQISAHSSHSYITGTNLYFVFSWRGTDDMEYSKQQYDTAWNIIMEETLRFNGSICHHHGVGKYRAKWMPEEHGSSYKMMRMLKDTFDPNSIMNIGTFLPEK